MHRISCVGLWVWEPRNPPVRSRCAESSTLSACANSCAKWPRGPRISAGCRSGRKGAFPVQHRPCGAIAGVPVLRWHSDFQAGCRGFESRPPLHFEVGCWRTLASRPRRSLYPLAGGRAGRSAHYNRRAPLPLRRASSTGDPLGRHDPPRLAHTRRRLDRRVPHLQAARHGLSRNGSHQPPDGLRGRR